MDWRDRDDQAEKIHLNSRSTTKSAPLAALSATEANTSAHSMSGDHRWVGFMRAETREDQTICYCCFHCKLSILATLWWCFSTLTFHGSSHTLLQESFWEKASFFFSRHNILCAKVLTYSSDGASNIPTMWLQILSQTILQQKKHSDFHRHKDPYGTIK